MNAQATQSMLGAVLEIRRVGNETFVVLTPELVAALGLSDGDGVSVVSVDNGGLTLRAASTDADLLARGLASAERAMARYEETLRTLAS